MRILERERSLINSKAPAGEIPPESLGKPLVYVCADIHGELGRYKRLLKEIKFSDDDELYILGDAIDRFPHGVDVLRDIMTHPNVHLLMGNHEDMCLRTFDNELDEIVRREWIVNDGEATHAAILSLSAQDRLSVLKFISELPDYVNIEVNGRKFHLVHAFPNSDPMERLWHRPSWDTPNPFPDKRTVIIGHTPVFYLSGNASNDFFRCLRGEMERDEFFKIAHAPGFIDIDCGCGSDIPNRRLACLRLNDMKEFYV